MSYTFFSADMHLSSSTTIEYCNRPYRDWQHMNECLYNNFNERMKEDDTLIHVGDFCWLGKGEKPKACEHEKRINAKIIHIIGNHDRNNSVKGMIDKAYITIGKYKALVIHIPPFDMMEDKFHTIDFIICGHVHKLWKHTFIEYTPFDKILRIPVINVGVDVWNYRPVRADELIGYYEKIRKEIKY